MPCGLLRQLFSARSDGCCDAVSCDAEGLEPAAFDAIASLAATLPLVFDYVAIAGPAALVPWVFAFAFAALSVLFALRKLTIFSGRIQVVPLEDDQVLDDFEADQNVWNDLLQLLVHHAIASFLVPALDDSTECSLALTCHFALDVFTVMQHGLSGVLVDVEAVLSAASPDLDDDKVTTQAAAASGAEVAVAFPSDDGVVSLSEEFFPQFFVGDTVNWRRSPKQSMFRMSFLPVTCFSTDWANRFLKFKQQLRWRVISW